MASGRKPGGQLQPRRRETPRRSAADDAHAEPSATPPTSSTTAVATMGAADRLGRRRAGDEEVDERRGDAVVESALDVDEPAHAAGTRSSCMTEAPRAASVGATIAPMRGGHPQAGTRKRSAASGRAGRDGEGQSDTEEAARERGVDPQGPHVDPRGVGEEHQGERDLGQGADGRRVEVQVDQRGGAVGDQDPEHHEGDGGRDVPAFEARRDETPQEDAGRDTARAARSRSWFMGGASAWRLGISQHRSRWAG